MSLLLGEGQQHLEAGVARGRGEAQVAVAPDDDPPADIAPEAGAPADGLGGVQGLQDVGRGRLGDAGAVVADLDQDPGAVAGGAPGQPAVPMTGERSWASPPPMHLPDKANDYYRAARRSTRRR